ncbi:hypothetical protein PLEOSDRAFT_1068280 [Pleurotus ostreatus PC15]|uniref:AB hydrolase-1 domain-containing protein n=1 Tax=Pleurotus ostreatus (strain PC15) TaxID=1137138 RepID=A0A067N5I1_PLEO1|nr:hypothetical protein PLEOSDRAFT_1068280 [Pleurotus ostreatus PC15]
MRTSRLVPGRYPPAGTSPIADAIRVRRGARGLTPLDGTLLHVPSVAEGWNSLLGAVRSKGKLPGDVRELMILRVAVWNRAAFEWIQHEPVGRLAGLTTQQLQVIRDTEGLLKQPLADLLKPLHLAALSFADSSTRDVKVPPTVSKKLMQELRQLVVEGDGFYQDNIDAAVQDLYVEASAVVATYNMVSRFLVATDVAGLSDEPLPWPADKQEHQIPIADAPDSKLHVVTHTTNPDAPWIILSNSLITDHSMWNEYLPYLLGPRREHNTFNVITFDQRGHGASDLPPPPSSTTPSSTSPIGPIPRCVTIARLAHDIAHILDALSISKVHAAIGVSQGGAAVLAFGALYPQKVGKIIACDTGPRTAPGNKDAWDERIALAKKDGMTALGAVTSTRWFPIPPEWQSDPTPSNRLLYKQWARDRAIAMIEKTSLTGFEAGAQALQDYDLLAPPEDSMNENYIGKSIKECTVPTLLVAGSLDGGGKVPQGMKKLADSWPAAQFVEVEGAGHLPMVDAAAAFWHVTGGFL